MRPVTNTIGFSHAIAAAIGGVVLACAAVATWLGCGEFAAPFYWLDIAVVYCLAALPLAASIVVAVWQRSDSPSYGLLALEIVVLLLIPGLYVHARTQNDIARSIELAGQSRYGEAGQLVHRTLQLVPSGMWNGQPLLTVATGIDEIVARLEAVVATPLAIDANDQERLRRAEALAMLGRAGQALTVLGAAPALASDAEACNLRGTIYETRREWLVARDWYAKSKAAWQPLAESPANATGLSRSITGVAFCERKAGHVREAEAAWLELLALAPTAESHFLLAQFYEDTQLTAKSKFHAQAAMRLDPGRYYGQGHRLLDNLVTSHFGCLGVFQTDETLTR